MDGNSGMIGERGVKDWASLDLIYTVWFVLGTRFTDIGKSMALTSIRRQRWFRQVTTSIQSELKTFPHRNAFAFGLLFEEIKVRRVFLFLAIKVSAHNLLTGSQSVTGLSLPKSFTDLRVNAIKRFFLALHKRFFSKKFLKKMPSKLLSSNLNPIQLLLSNNSFTAG